MKRGWMVLVWIPLVSSAGCGRGENDTAVLRIAMPPGRIADFERVLVPGFAPGVRVEAIGMRSSDQVVRLRVERARPSVDLLWVDFGEAQLLGREGLIERLAVDEVPNLVSVRPEARSELGIAPVTFSSALGFLYNTERLPEPPRSWRALWEPRYRSELALFDFGSTLGPAFLTLAARLFGGGENDIEPGFAKLAELAPHVVTFQSSGPANNLLVAEGEAGLTLGLASQALALKKNGAPVDWLVPEEGALALPQGFQVVKNAHEPDLARRFVDYAFSLEVQTRLAQELLLAVTSERVTLPEEVQKLVPLDNIIYLDFEIISAERGGWTDRFNREILAH